MNGGVIAKTHAYFEKAYFLDDLKKLQNRLKKCVELKGYYLNFFFLFNFFHSKFIPLKNIIWIKQYIAPKH